MAAEKMGIRLESRTINEIRLQTPTGVEVYRIIHEFPFNSERKRMGIVVQPEGMDDYLFYLKGADNVMKMKVPDVQRGFLMDECETLSREGLRTLVVTQKYLTKEDY